MLQLGVTATGSMVVFGKFSALLDSKLLSLPRRDGLNLSMVTMCVVGVALFLNPSLALGFVSTNPETIKLASLGVVATISSILGIHLTGSIGGADVPVMSTVLNSYSGWALCAEGFFLGNPLLA